MTFQEYDNKIRFAVHQFWHTRTRQLDKQSKRNIFDQRNRGAVTGGKQMDGFIQLLFEIAVAKGIHEDFIHTKSNYLPGYFRPSKEWDFLITTRNNDLVCAIELKSQVGSFGNNFNNRIEESLGSSLDLSTAILECGGTLMPWIGYLVVIENSEKSTLPVQVQEKLYKVRHEFNGMSYMQRYDLFCKKVMQKKLYSYASVLWTKPDFSFGDCSEETSINMFLKSYVFNLQQFRKSEFS